MKITQLDFCNNWKQIVDDSGLLLDVLCIFDQTLAITFTKSLDESLIDVLKETIKILEHEKEI